MNDALSKGITDIYLEPGVHILTKRLNISEEVTISGAGRGITFVQGGGFSITGKKGKKCTLMDFTVQKTEEHGLNGYCGMSFDCLRIHFDQCGNYQRHKRKTKRGGHGVIATATKGRLTNCQITQSKESGVYSHDKSTIEIEGEETMIEKNYTIGNVARRRETGKGDEYQYGLKTWSSGIIHILSPLTKESISKNNHNGNYGGPGTIQTVTSLEPRDGVSGVSGGGAGETKTSSDTNNVSSRIYININIRTLFLNPSYSFDNHFSNIHLLLFRVSLLTLNTYISAGIIMEH